MSNWSNANNFESDYWNKFTCEVQTLKHQEFYIDALDLRKDYFCANDNSLNFSGKKILDIGGGPVSILLRSNNLYGDQHDGIGEGVIIDPVKITNHHLKRYEFNGLNFINDKAENLLSYYMNEKYFDECIIYNCLQHTENPTLILDSALKVSKKIRLAEPLNQGTDECHLHNFSNSYFFDYFNNKNLTIKKHLIVEIGVPHDIFIVETT